MLKVARWNVDPLITITIVVRGAMHKQSLEALQKLKIPLKESKKLIRIHTSNIHKIPHISCPKHKKARQQSSPNQPTHEPQILTHDSPKTHKQHPPPETII